MKINHFIPVCLWQKLYELYKLYKLDAGTQYTMNQVVFNITAH